jgi:SAM-dependent methyltransferase
MALTKRLLAHSALAERSLLVDIGCGSGATLQYLSAACNYQAVGVDASLRNLQMAHRQGFDTTLACGVGHFLPFPGAWVDAVLTECSLAIMGNLQALFCEFWRILKPGGYLLASDLYIRKPEGALELRELQGECYLKQISTQAEILEWLNQTGFAIRLWEDHSEQLKGFTLQRALKFCSVDGLKIPPKVSAPRPDPLDLQLALSKARLGYYLLVAEKV